MKIEINGRIVRPVEPGDRANRLIDEGHTYLVEAPSPTGMVGADGRPVLVIVGGAVDQDNAVAYARGLADGTTPATIEEKLRAKGFKDGWMPEEATNARWEAMAAAVAEDSPQEARQHQRRIDHLATMFNRVFARDRASVGTGVDATYVTFEEYRDMQADYAEAVAKGEGQRCEFQPLSAYLSKIVKTNDAGEIVKVLRHPYQHEVGMLYKPGDRDRVDGRIVLLRETAPDSIGTVVVQVPGDNTQEKP